MADRPTVLLLTGDLDLAARLQTLVRTRLQVRVVWCASVREVEEHLASDAAIGLVVEVPRRSSRMLRLLRNLAGRIPTVALTRPHDEPLDCRCLAVGALHVVQRRPSHEDRLLVCLDSLRERRQRQALARHSYAASLRPAAAPPPREVSLPA